MYSNSNNDISLSIETKLQENDNLTAEQEEEVKLKAKYPNTHKPGGSQFILKMLTKGNKKYFDSGDYNMAKSKIKSNGFGQQTALASIQHNTSLTPSSPSSVLNNSHNYNSNNNKDSDDSCQSPAYLSSPCSNLNHNKYYSCMNYTNDLTNDILADENTLYGHKIPTPECLPTRKHSIVQNFALNTVPVHGFRPTQYV